MMSNKNQKIITIGDFDVICRVCLQIRENMIDIYESGIENHLTEITHLKVKFGDELPRTLCQECSQQVNQFVVFLEQAKSSDAYLRSLLVDSKASCADKELKASEEKKRKRKTTYKKSMKRQKKIESDSETDDMYLIYVPESKESDSKADKEICIKDLNSESDNPGLTDYCRKLINYLSNEVEQKDFLEKDCESKDMVYQGDSYLELNSEESKIYTINLFVYECNECQNSFEYINDLTEHFKAHGMEPTFTSCCFTCPVCDISINEKTEFFIHLQTHQEEGFSFIKVNAFGEIIPPEANEKDLFIESVTEGVKHCKVFYINLLHLNCAVCFENIKSKDFISEHLNSCLSKDKSQIKFKIRYSCPVCYTSFHDDEKNFLEHLNSHNGDNCYFLKQVSGETDETEENDKLFVPFDEAVTFLVRKNSVFKIIEQLFCQICNHRSENFSEMFDHYDSVHSEKFSFDLSFCCPVCSVEYAGDNVDKEQVKFYEHLRNHKSEGMTFVLVKTNGEMADLIDAQYSDLFTQSGFLWSVITVPALLFQTVTPELIVFDLDDSPISNECEGQCKRKQGIIVCLKAPESNKSNENNGNFICEKCGKKCLGRVNYSKHFLKHSENFSSVCKKPICVICNKTFANRGTLNSHMNEHLREGKEQFCASVFGIICDKCGKNFSNKASLTKHRATHFKEKEFSVMKCEICGKEFFKQSLFERHKSAHLNPKYFECHVCKIPLPSVKSLKKHSGIHKSGSNTFDCKDCKLSFLTKDSLSAHESHTGHYQDRKPLECNVCHEKFFLTRKFMEHIKTHPKYKMGQCTLCGKRLSTIQSLMLHMGRHFESNCILCPHCGKQFFEEKNYHRHLLTHEGIKPFTCDKEGCKKSFYTFFELNRHKKYHDNTRDFSCPFCSKSFHEANHLTVHVRTHTGERPYACPHCNKGFVTRTHCKHHIKLIHQGVGYDLIKSSISKKVTVFQTIETTAESNS